MAGLHREDIKRVGRRKRRSIIPHLRHC